MNNIRIYVQALKDQKVTKQHCEKMISHGNAVDRFINWTAMTEHIRQLGGYIVREDIRQLCHRGLSEPYVSKESREFAMAIMITAERIKLEPLNLERFI